MKKDSKNIINGYELVTEFTTKNAGMCQWAFCTKAGNEYFIKRLLSPKYPSGETMLPTEIVDKMRAEADDFYKKRKAYYETIKNNNNGNIVAVEDFFRNESFYYLVSPRIDQSSLTVKDISMLEDEKKKVLMKIILYSLMAIHEQRLVHSDLKPDNIIIKLTSHGYCAAKIIDFESGFFESDVPEEIEGDQVYFSPEVMRKNDGDDVEVTTKADIFALGVLFHQYWSGKLPAFDSSNISAGVALLNEESVDIDPSIPADIAGMLKKMIDIDPENRPSAKQAWNYLCFGDYDHVEEEPEEAKSEAAAVAEAFAEPEVEESGTAGKTEDFIDSAQKMAPERKPLWTNATDDDL